MQFLERGCWQPLETSGGHQPPGVTQGQWLPRLYLDWWGSAVSGILAASAEPEVASAEPEVASAEPEVVSAEHGVVCALEVAASLEQLRVGAEGPQSETEHKLPRTRHRQE